LNGRVLNDEIWIGVNCTLPQFHLLSIWFFQKKYCETSAGLNIDGQTSHEQAYRFGETSLIVRRGESTFEMGDEHCDKGVAVSTTCVKLGWIINLLQKHEHEVYQNIQNRKG